MWRGLGNGFETETQSTMDYIGPGPSMCYATASGLLFYRMEEGKTCQDLLMILRLSLSKSVFTFSKSASYRK